MAVPSRPTNLRAVQNGTSARVDLTWTDNATNETVYKIERKTDRGSWVEIKADGAANLTSYSDTSVTLGIFYEYRVRCANADGNSEYSNEVEIIPTKVGSFSHVKDRLLELICSSTKALYPQSSHVFGNLYLDPNNPIRAGNIPFVTASINPMRHLDAVYGRRMPNNVAGVMFEVDFKLFVYAKNVSGDEYGTEAQAVADLIIDYLNINALGQSAYKIHNIYDLRSYESSIGVANISRIVIEGTLMTSRAD